MAFDKPSDLVVIAGIFLIVMTVIGLGILSVEEQQEISVDDSYFTVTISNGVSNLKNTSDDISTSLIGQEGSGSQTSEESIITRSFNSILTIGRSYNVIEDNMRDLGTQLGIPSSIITIVLAMLLVVFGVVTYTWFRGTR